MNVTRVPEILEGLVLRKKTYGGNTGLLFWILHPQLGKIPCWWKYPEKKVPTKKYYTVDILRILQIETSGYTDEGFYLVRQVYVLEDFSALASCYDSFNLACFILEIVWENTHPHMSARFLYQGVRNILYLLNKDPTIPPIILLVGMGLVLCYQEGVLPLSTPNDEKIRRLQNTLDSFLTTNRPFPDYPLEQWHKILGWIQKLSHDSHIYFPTYHNIPKP